MHVHVRACVWEGGDSLPRAQACPGTLGCVWPPTFARAPPSWGAQVVRLEDVMWPHQQMELVRRYRLQYRLPVRRRVRRQRQLSAAAC